MFSTQDNREQFREYQKEVFMIKANDLRVTNLIMNDGIVNAVIMIGIDAVELVTPQGNTITAQLDLIQPIPLTKEWLTKLGFYINDNNEPEIDTNKDYALSISIMDTPYKNTAWHVLKREHKYYMMAETLYVHSVQNLYYSLTGEELAITQTYLNRI